MGTKHSEATKKKKALEALRAWAESEGVELDIKEPDESPSDLMREAQSVIDYFETGGRGYKERPCKYCELPFKYKWNSNSIAYCSITCAAKALKEIGLEWDPSKPPEERWGKTIPAVVPPQALSLLENQADSQGD